MDDVAEGVADDLDLDMPRILDEFLDEHLAAPEACLRFRSCSFPESRKLFRAIHPPDASTTAAGDGFEEDRVADIFRYTQCIVIGRNGAFGSRDNRATHRNR